MLLKKILKSVCGDTRGLFLETPDNFPGLKTILGAQ